MAKERRKFLLPIWGYALMNVLFLGAMVAFYYLSVAYFISEEKDQVASAGIFPVLATCYIAFSAVSIYDAVFERAARKHGERKPDMEEPVVLASQEKVRKPD